LFYTLSLLAFACKKEELPPIEPITPIVSPIYIPIYQPGDTSMGAAYANKLTAFWRADTYCKKSFSDSTKLILHFYTYTADGSRRESVGFGPFSKNGIGTYKLSIATTSIVPPNEALTVYATWASDGDLLEDYYFLDSTDLKNRLVITKLDLPNKRVEGSFHVSYNIQEPRYSARNPKKVTFSKGRFWAAIRD